MINFVDDGSKTWTRTNGCPLSARKRNRHNIQVKAKNTTHVHRLPCLAISTRWELPQSRAAILHWGSQSVGRHPLCIDDSSSLTIYSRRTCAKGDDCHFSHERKRLAGAAAAARVTPAIVAAPTAARPVPVASTTTPSSSTTAVRVSATAPTHSAWKTLSTSSQPMVALTDLTKLTAISEAPNSEVPSISTPIRPAAPSSRGSSSLSAAAAPYIPPSPPPPPAPSLPAFNDDETDGVYFYGAPGQEPSGDFSAFLDPPLPSRPRAGNSARDDSGSGGGFGGPLFFWSPSQGASAALPLPNTDADW